MKKIIFLSILVLAIFLISAGRQSIKNDITDKNVSPASLKDFNEGRTLKAGESKDITESLKQKKSAEGRPRILNLLIDKKGSSPLSPYLWWSYQHTKAGQTGC